MLGIDPLAQEITERLIAWDEQRDPRTRKWHRHSRVARLQEDPADSTRPSEKSQLKMPTTKAAITMAVDNLYQMLFGSQRYFEVKGRTFDSNFSAEIAENYLGYLFDKSRLKLQMRRFLYDLCTYGTGIVKVNIDTFKERSVVPSPEPEKENKQFVLQQKDFARPSLEYVNVFDFFIEGHAIDIQSSEGVIKRKFEKLYKLKQRERAGLLTNVSDILTSDNIDMDDDLRAMLLKAGIIENLTDSDITIYEYWGWMDEDILKEANFKGDIQDGGAEIVAEVANGTVLINLMPNPLLTQERPFLKECFEEIPGQFYGLSIPDIADGPQEALNSTVRSRIDNKKLSINQVFAIDLNRTMQKPGGSLYPGKTFFTRGNPRDVVQSLPIPDVTGGAHIEAESFKNMIHESTGLSPILAGMLGGKNQTATEASIAQSQSSVRLRFIALQIEEFVMHDIIRWFYQLALQFLESETIAVTKNGLQENLEITPQRIHGDYDFRAVGVMEMTNKNNSLKLMQFLSTTANQFDIAVTDRAYLLQQVYKGFGFNDAERVFGNGKGDELLGKVAGVSGVGSQPALTNTSPDGQPSGNLGVA